ncbi:conserved hypothetical protein, unlikely [Trypanosoma brucei gambiense DAL972]|uniref:Uncharacterized protein n=1 Tax=Trypanosoma brucei gambiense (strain MHOM/CI/86/DAL972) TaxID=679716 RepID=C9ZZJ7_TRYB9|nr:conserved hypothetical protein, unlikely [Trypanosoma brucei gambiense DAL972]CBH14846.1 conserved hypothetical protein, unlikely [Trypanosoma brucei gambiense DAL972]|eukprot:XP_011777112.1 conserved hypothetical protein, unlikely [Trypanosoma brucei gambiense DAL972]
MFFIVVTVIHLRTQLTRHPFTEFTHLAVGLAPPTMRFFREYTRLRFQKPTQFMRLCPRRRHVTQICDTFNLLRPLGIPSNHEECIATSLRAELLLDKILYIS